ncbi:MAG: hypothetical protein V3S22_04380 [Candidatus Neomarinimicrobiota bacterium]
MEISKKTKVALWWQKKVHRKQGQRSSLISVSEGNSIKKILICLPDHRRDYDFVLRFLKSVDNALGPFPTKTLLYMGLTRARAGMGLEMKNESFLYTPQELNSFGLPAKPLLERAAKIKTDMILDLNPEFSPVIASLSLVIKAPFKVGFYTEENKDYYNILLRKRGTDLIDSGFKELHQLLGIK